MRCRLPLPRWFRLVASLTVAVLAACGRPVPMEDMPAPRLVAAQPFTFAPAAERVDDAGEPARSSFADRLAQRTGGVAPETQSTARSVRNVSLSGVLVGSVPSDWSCSSEGEMTLISHAGIGGAPDALIYIQGFSDRAESRPTAEVNRFYQAVDPTLASGWLRMWEELEAQTLRLASALAMPEWQVLDALGRLLSPTLGRGLGYEPWRGTFTGWKWLGRNEHEVFLRLGRSRGEWGPQGELPRRVRALLEELAVESARLEELLWEPALGLVPPTTAAYQVVGSAALEVDRGVHLAILCRQTPECEVRDDLVRFVESLRPPEAGLDPACRPGLVDFALEIGLQLVPEAGQELAREVRRAMAALAPEEADVTDSAGAPTSGGATEPEPRETTL